MGNRLQLKEGVGDLGIRSDFVPSERRDKAHITGGILLEHI